MNSLGVQDWVGSWQAGWVVGYLCLVWFWQEVLRGGQVKGCFVFVWSNRVFSLGGVGFCFCILVRCFRFGLFVRWEEYGRRSFYEGAEGFFQREVVFGLVLLWVQVGLLVFLFFEIYYFVFTCLQYSQCLKLENFRKQKEVFFYLVLGGMFGNIYGSFVLYFGIFTFISREQGSK